MNLLDVFKASQFRQENEELKKLIEEAGAGDAVALKKVVDKLKKEQDSLNNEIIKKNDEIKSLDQQILEKRNQLLVVDEELLLESFALYKPKFNFQSSDEYKKRLEIIRDKQKALIKNGQAASGSQTWTVNNSKSQGKKWLTI